MNDPISQNVAGVQSLVSSKLNKVNITASDAEGVIGQKIDEFKLDLTDDELLSLKRDWETKYEGYEAKLKLRQQKNKQFYLGQQKAGTSQSTDDESISANLLFEAEETFLPAALSKNPEPVVWSDNTDEGTKISNDVKTMLQYHADTLVLRAKLTLTTRHWSIYFIGVLKHGWDEEIKEITTEVRDPRNFIFDPDGFIDAYADYVGYYIGERITVTASRLIELFPSHKVYIIAMTDGKLGTDVVYTEWWTDEYCFYSFKDKILEKNKNPHFNYATNTKEQDIDGNEIVHEHKGNNHFAKPKKPYTFLSVFSLGEQPHDITSLIEQNIPNQRRVTRRTEQIDYNLSRQNNSDIFSENNFNQETSKQAASAMAKGHPVLVPAGGPLNEAIHRLPGQGVDASYFNELENSKNDLRSIFGTEGLTAQAPEPNELATGIIKNEQHDSSRIGGGIGDRLEQVVDNTFNWWVQLYYVYYTVEHVASIMGQMKAVEYVTLSSQNFDRKLVISVSPNSMKPKDELTEMQQAMSLWEAKALDPKTLLTRLNFPDPQKTAEQTVLWLLDPGTYLKLNFPNLVQDIQQSQQEQQMQLQQAQQQELQLQGQSAQQDMATKGAQTDQQLAIKQATTEQQLQQKQQMHDQKLKHQDEQHKTKLDQQKKAIKSPIQKGELTKKS